MSSPAGCNMTENTKSSFAQYDHRRKGKSSAWICQWSGSSLQLAIIGRCWRQNGRMSQETCLWASSHRRDLVKRQDTAGWWLTYPSEKWWTSCQLGWWHSIPNCFWKVIIHSMVPVTTNQWLLTIINHHYPIFPVNLWLKPRSPGCFWTNPWVPFQGARSWRSADRAGTCRQLGVNTSTVFEVM